MTKQQEPVAYPEGDVVGACICGSWPGGKCLKCPRVTAPPQQEPTQFPEGYELHEIPADYDGKVWIEGQVRRLHEHAKAPLKREWQGLTDEEIFDVIRPFCKDDETAEMLIDISMDEYRAIEAKLKEKNT